MDTPTRIAVKHVGIAIVVLALGVVSLRLIEGVWLDLRGLGAIGALIGMSVAWSAREGYAAGKEEAQARANGGQSVAITTDAEPRATSDRGGK